MPPASQYKARKLVATIDHCDPATRSVSGRIKDGGAIQIMVWEIPSAFVWPQEGERWYVHQQQSGPWMLGSRIEGADDEHSVEALSPGEGKIHANTVVDAAGRSFVATETSQLGSGQGLLWTGAGWAPHTFSASSDLTGTLSNATIGDKKVTTRKVFLDTQSQAGITEGYRAGLGAAGDTMYADAAATIAMRITYTPAVNCWWEVHGQIGIVRKDDANYNYMYGGILLNVPDVDGNSAAYHLVTQNGTVNTFEGRTMTRRFKLAASTAYTATLMMSGGDGGSWSYYQGPNQLWIQGKAWAR